MAVLNFQNKSLKGNGVYFNELVLIITKDYSYLVSLFNKLVELMELGACFVVKRTSVKKTLGFCWWVKEQNSIVVFWEWKQDMRIQN